jgi:exopolysaccharide production protein ExoQ
VTIPRHIVNIVRDGYIVAMLMLSTGAFVSMFVKLDDSSVAGQGSPVFKIAWGAIYALTCLRIFSQRHRIALLFRANRSLIFLVSLSLISALWSIDASTTIHLGATLALTTIIGIDMCIYYSIKRQLELICISLVLIMGLSVVAEVFLPGVVPGRGAEGTAWHGVFGFKNDFGRLICLAVVACLALSRRSAWLRIVIVVTGIALAVLSKSASAVGYVVFLALLFVMWSVLKWKTNPKRFALAVIFLVTSLTVYFVSQNLTQVTAVMDKDPHLTGRVDLWQLSIADIQKKPILGYGYQAFWGYTSQPARRIREAVNWDEAPHAHDGYIDLSLSLGLLGLATYCFVFCIIARRAYVFFMQGPESYRRWPLSFLAFVLVYQLTESSIVGGNSILWITFCTLAFSLSTAKEEAKVQELTELSATAA